MIYICTAGTSAAKLWPDSVGQGKRFDANFVGELGGIKAASEALLDTFKVYSMDDQFALQSKLSAEIHSLARMNLAPEDRVVLFASETQDGQACALAVAEYLEINGFTARVETIQGLQTTDAQLFRKHGVVEFIKRAAKYIDDNGSDGCILNPTGGFKALVPYAVLLGMIKRVRCSYIFEFSSEIIDLPPLPVDFARSNLEAIKEVMTLIERESAVPVKQFEEQLPWEQRQSYKLLFEQEGSEVTLSGIGVLMLEELQKPSALSVYISQEAMKGLEKLRGMADVDPLEYLLRVSKDFSKLEKDKHGNAGNGLTWLKPGNTRDRYLVSIEDEWKLLVWEMHEHSAYDQRSKMKNLGSSVKAMRGQRYSPFFRMDFVD